MFTRSQKEDESGIERLWNRERVWITVDFVSVALGTLVLCYLDFDWSMVVQFQKLRYLLFIYDLLWISRELRNHEDKAIMICVYEQFASVGLVIASRTFLSSIPVLPELLEAMAMFLVCECCRERKIR